MAGLEQARLDRVELSARRRDNARRPFVLPGRGGMPLKPLRDPALPRRIRGGSEEQSGTAFGGKFELELHPFILAERADKGCPRPEISRKKLSYKRFSVRSEPSCFTSLL